MKKFSNIQVRRRHFSTISYVDKKYVKKKERELMKATVLAESYTLYLLSSRPADSSDVL